MKKIDVLYANIDDQNFSQNWVDFLQKLPTHLQKHCLKFHRIEDQKKRVLGFFLLSQSFQSLDLNPNLLLTHSWDQYKKPYIKDSPYQFSLSYSQNLVICAIGDQPLGIDIEFIDRTINLQHFESFFPKPFWEEILNSDNPTIQFYEHWTLFEAAMKAYGLGIAGPIKNIQCKNNRIITEGLQWQYHKIAPQSSYLGHICCEYSEDIFLKKAIF